MSTSPTIRLGQYLKLVGLAATGGEAKYLIQEGHVRVNGEVETRRKRQLHVGDRVALEDRSFTVANEDLSAPPSPRSASG
jgi:ribosome-associated protein